MSPELTQYSYDNKQSETNNKSTTMLD